MEYPTQLVVRTYTKDIAKLWDQDRKKINATFFHFPKLGSGRYQLIGEWQDGASRIVFAVWCADQDEAKQLRGKLVEWAEDDYSDKNHPPTTDPVKTITGPGENLDVPAA